MNTEQYCVFCCFAWRCSALNWTWGFHGILLPHTTAATSVVARRWYRHHVCCVRARSLCTIFDFSHCFLSPHRPGYKINCVYINIILLLIYIILSAFTTIFHLKMVFIHLYTNERTDAKNMYEYVLCVCVCVCVSVWCVCIYLMAVCWFTVILFFYSIVYICVYIICKDLHKQRSGYSHYTTSNIVFKQFICFFASAPQHCFLHCHQNVSVFSSRCLWRDRGRSTPILCTRL